MKNALLLHGTNNNSQGNWLPWLKGELEMMGYIVWSPDLPKAESPNTKRYNEFIFSNKEFNFNEETIIVGHSSGSVAALGLLQNLPEGVKIHSVYLVSAFKDSLPHLNLDLEGLFEEPLNLEIIKTHAGKFIFFHSDNDPYCPLEGAKYLAEQLNGEMNVLSGQKHFNISTAGEKYKQFLELLSKIKEVVK